MRWLGYVSSALLIATAQCLAAEVSCVELVSLGKGGLADSTRFEDEARKLWPSGARPQQNSCTKGYLEGPLSPGTYARVARFFAEQHPFLETVVLNSPGGDFEEAMQIGRLFRKYLITTRAPLRFSSGGSLVGDLPAAMVRRIANPTCIGACAVVWFGGPDRMGTVGLRHPDPDDRPAGASGAQHTRAQLLHELAQYLEEMEVPRSSVDSIVGTPPEEIVWLTAKALPIAAHRSPSFAAWSSASCGSLTPEEERELDSIVQKGLFGGPLPQQDEHTFEALAKKITQIESCESVLKASTRDKLPNPVAP